MIIAFSGYAGAGKDTAANILVEQYGFTKLAFAQPIKDALYTLNPLIEVEHVEEEGLNHIYLRDLVQDPNNDSDWSYAKEFDEVRRLLQVFGTEVGRKQFNDFFWVDLLFSKIEDDKNYVITDMRFPNELAQVELYKGTTVRINYGEPANTHPSETSLDGSKFDVTIENNGTLEDFESVVKLLCESLDLTQVK